MDPLTALGLVSNILQLIDFGTKFVAGAKEIYDSIDGASDDSRALAFATQQLNDICDDLALSRPSSSPALKRINAISSKCHSVGREILIHLDNIRLRSHGRKFGSLRAAFKELRYKDVIAKLAEQLGRLQQDLHTALLESLT